MLGPLAEKTCFFKVGALESENQMLRGLLSAMGPQMASALAGPSLPSAGQLSQQWEATQPELM